MQGQAPFKMEKIKILSSTVSINETRYQTKRDTASKYFDPEWDTVYHRVEDVQVRAWMANFAHAVNIP